LLVLPPLLLLVLPQLLRPNRQFGPDQALRLLEACVLVTVLTREIDVEPLHRFGLALVHWWMCELAGGVAFRGYVRRLGVLDLHRWWGGFGLSVG
jgi:hypothetical protein